MTLSRWPCLLHPYTWVERWRKRIRDIVRKRVGEYVPLLVWMGEMISNMDWSSSIVRLYMMTSDLTCLVPLQFSYWLQVRKVVTPVIMIMIMTVMMMIMMMMMLMMMIMMMMMIIKMIRRSINKVRLTAQSVFTWRHAAILVFQNNETAVMLVFQTSFERAEPSSYVKTFFGSNKFVQLRVTQSHVIQTSVNCFGRGFSCNLVPRVIFYSSPGTRERAGEK